MTSLAFQGIHYALHNSNFSVIGEQVSDRDLLIAILKGTYSCNTHHIPNSVLQCYSSLLSYFFFLVYHIIPKSVSNTMSHLGWQTTFRNGTLDQNGTCELVDDSLG